METKMNVKFNVKRKYKFEGKEYDSIEDMPAEGQAAFKKAMPSESDLAEKLDLQPGQTNKIIYNGKEYDLNDLPPIVRKIYEKLIPNTQREPGAIEPSSASETSDVSGSAEDIHYSDIPAEPIAPKATSPAVRFILSLIALGTIVFLIYYLRR